MSDNENTPSIGDHTVLTIPAFGKSLPVSLEMGNIREAEARFIEAKNVNPSTFSDLEFSFNESYRDLKRHLSNIGYQIELANKALREAKANVILGSYADHMKGKPKYQDNSDLRDAFLIRDPDYIACMDRLAQLKALESNFDGKLKTLENVSRGMRQKMYLFSKNGASMDGLYVTSGKK